MACEVRWLEAARVPEAIAVLRDAFLADPLYRYLVPDDADRARLLEALGRGLVPALLAHGEVLAAVDGRVRGLLGLVGPDAAPLPAARELGIAARLVRSQWHRPGALALARRAFRAWRIIGRGHAELGPAHFYLCIIGVAPDAQGSGIGTALLRPPLARADRERRPFYLETASPANLPFYRRFGFETLSELVPGPGAPPVWTMLRPPAAVRPPTAS
ncbi:MAG: GNAT family N-acetyltransferase [Myxococcales bacterium]|nr:GNAT family N-acetyltransferase [Myxococcales bacterium]